MSAVQSGWVGHAILAMLLLVLLLEADEGFSQGFNSGEGMLFNTEITSQINQQLC